MEVISDIFQVQIQGKQNKSNKNRIIKRKHGKNRDYKYKTKKAFRCPQRK